MSNPRQNKKLHYLWLNKVETKEMLNAVRKEDLKTIGRIIRNVYNRGDFEEK